MRVAVAKILPVNHCTAYSTFWPFWITEFILIYIEKRILLKPVVDVVNRIAHVITGHEQIYCKRVCHLLFFGVFLVSTSLTIHAFLKHFEIPF